MKYRQLGNTGLKVSEICLGTMTFGHTTDEPEAKRIMEKALEAGVNFFDTANTYAGSRSEVFTGRALREHRDEVVVTTKFYNPTGSGPNDSGMSRYHIMNAIEASLRRLSMDHIDIYYIHHVDQQTPIEEMLRALDDLVRQGKVRYIGCSNYEAWRLMEALHVSESHDISRFICYQPQYSLVVRDIEIDLVPACRYKGLGIVAWSPLAGGFLSGKYRPGLRSLDGTRSAEKWVFPERYFAPNADETLSELLSVSKRIGKTPAQVAIRWVLDRPGLSSAIVGARTVMQLEDNLGAVGWALDSGEADKLTEISAPRIKYPESMEWPRDVQRLSAIKLGDPE